MDKLKYKTYIWPTNPEHYHQKYVRSVLYLETEAGEKTFNGMGEPKRIISGKGVFFGEEAYEQFKGLIDLFREGQHGTLIHPIWGNCECFFTKLELTQEPRADYVAYQFEFREVDEEGKIPV